eukprot:3008223-Amphidinium_carterae.1
MSWQEHTSHPNPLALVAGRCGSKTLASEESSHRREPSRRADQKTARSQNKRALQGSLPYLAP